MSRFRDTRNRVLNRILSHRQVLRYAMKASPENVKDIRVVLEDHQLLVDPATAIGRHVVKNGSWNREQIELIRGQLPTNLLDGQVIELGGNIGTETVGFLLSGFSHVYSVEPDTDNIERLNMNLLINHLSDRATVCNAAVGSSAGKGQLTKYFGNPGANTLLKNDGDSAEEVVVITGDKLVSHYEIDVSKVSLIWMDIEGFEIEAIAGMKKLLKSLPFYPNQRIGIMILLLSR